LEVGGAFRDNRSVPNSEEMGLSDEVAASLREASRRIANLDADEPTRHQLGLRLLAATHAAKRDLTVAARRLEQLTLALDALTASGSSAPVGGTASVSTGLPSGDLPATQE
jgi:hypothetical protein